MSGTEFEKAAGIGKAKKWKTSVRVSAEDGKQGEMVGDWLQVGLLYRDFCHLMPQMADIATHCQCHNSCASLTFSTTCMPLITKKPCHQLVYAHPHVPLDHQPKPV